MFIPNDVTQNNTFCRLKLVVEMFGQYTTTSVFCHLYVSVHLSMLAKNNDKKYGLLIKQCTWCVYSKK